MFKPITCRCGKQFTPTTSRNKHCSPECRFSEIASKFSGDSCWVWPKSFFKSTGYGQFAISADVPETAHRMAFKVFKGKIPDGLFVCHSCDNRSCFNPSHLFLGTCQDNVTDMFSKGREQDYSKSAAKRVGLRRGYKSKKFTTQQIAEMHKLLSGGHSAREVGRRFNTDHKVVLNAVAGSKDKTELLANSAPKVK